jgi:hypothetical protein
VSFDDRKGDSRTVFSRARYRKIRQCYEKAPLDRFNYLWIYTCCIDKRNSLQLSEAINATFNQYPNSAVCVPNRHTEQENLCQRMCFFDQLARSPLLHVVLYVNAFHVESLGGCNTIHPAIILLVLVTLYVCLQALKVG